MKENILGLKKIRITPFREAVIKVFQNHENAIGLNTIEQEVGDFDRITLYRTLKTFIEEGIIHEISLPGEEKKMALCEEECHTHEAKHTHEHIHFQCKKCLEVYCVKMEQFPQINLPTFKIDSLEINAKGLCSACCD